jgi:hypothetical protein
MIHEREKSSSALFVVPKIYFLNLKKKVKLPDPDQEINMFALESHKRFGEVL